MVKQKLTLDNETFQLFCLYIRLINKITFVTSPSQTLRNRTRSRSKYLKIVTQSFLKDIRELDVSYYKTLFSD